MPTPVKSTSWQQRSVFLALALLITIGLFSPVKKIAEVTLDSSNYASYAYFTAKEYQYGKDVLPMAGPYGFVPYGFSYSGHLYWKRLPLELLTKFVLALLIIWFVRRTPHRPIINSLWLLSLLFLAPLITDLPYILAILLTGLCLLECHLARDRISLITACGLAAYLALLTLFKGTQCMLACATLGLLCLQSLWQRDFKRLPWILGSYLVALIVWLVIAGQNPLNFPRYFAGMLEISSGYNLAMGVDEPWAHFLLGLSALVSVEILLWLTLWGQWRQPQKMVGGLYLAGFTFLSFKHGFVRADGHVTIFFHYVAIAVPTIILFASPAYQKTAIISRRLLVGSLATITLSLALWANMNTVATRWQWMAQDLVSQLVLNLKQISHPGGTKAKLDAELNINRDYYRLARLQELVGTSPVDFFGNEEGYLMLNRLNYRPRPVGGGTFSVFTTKLRALNTAWLDQPERRPEYYLVNVDSIDERFVPQEDAGTLRTLLAHYAPREVILGLPLFAALPSSIPSPELHPLNSQVLTWDQPVNIPTVDDSEMLFVSISIPPSLLGRLRTFLYKPPSVFMNLRGDRIEYPDHRRIIPSMTAQPMPLNPLIENNSDLLNLYQSKADKLVRNFTVTTDYPSCFASDQMRVRFSRGPRPEQQPPPKYNSRHPSIAENEPDAIEAPLAPVYRFNKMVVQSLVPPGRMGFNLGGDEKAVTFSYGMVPEAYLHDTDGVDITVELERPGVPLQQLFVRRLDPVRHEADQGVHSKVLPLPPLPSGSKLWFNTGRGPNNNGAWDLVYFTRIKFSRGSYLISEFPGFSRVPDKVEAGSSGRMPDGQREVFMLNAPGRLYFNLNGSEQKVSLGFGILSGAWRNGGNTDGVSFQILLRSKAGKESAIYTRLLDPLNVGSDRGDQHIVIDLPPVVSGAQLIITTLPGPKGDQAWDWSYLESLRLE